MTKQLTAVGHAAAPTPPTVVTQHRRPDRSEAREVDDVRSRAEDQWADLENIRWLGVKEAVRRWQQLDRVRAQAMNGHSGPNDESARPAAPTPEPTVPQPIWLSFAVGVEFASSARPAPDRGATTHDRHLDAELVARLAEQEFRGAEHERFINHLARYGLAVIGPWVKTGYILQRCAERRIKGLPSPIPSSWTAEDVEDLVQDTVALAVTDFERNALRGGRWRPDGGAALATYFIGTCLFAFAQVYRRRHDGWRRDLAVSEAMSRVVDDERPDIAEAVVAQDTVSDFLAATTPDPRLRLVVFLHCAGYRTTEIATVLDDGTSARAVEGMLYRYRKQISQGRGADQDER